MIEVKYCEWYNTETLTLLCEGVNSRYGVLSLICGNLDMDLNPNEFFLNVINEKDNNTGHYAPLSMKKKELRIFLDFAEKCYKDMK